MVKKIRPKQIQAAVVPSEVHLLNNCHEIVFTTLKYIILNLPRWSQTNSHPVRITILKCFRLEREYL